MNSIKLTIFTGKQDTDIIDLGLYNPSIVGVLSTSSTIANFFEDWLDGQDAKDASEMITGMIADISNNAEKYSAFHVADLLAAQDYLTKLKIACDTYPSCTVVIESL